MFLKNRHMQIRSSKRPALTYRPNHPSVLPTRLSYLPIPSIHPPTRELRNVFLHTWPIWSMCIDMLPKTYGMQDPKIVLTLCFQNVWTVRSSYRHSSQKALIYSQRKTSSPQCMDRLYGPYMGWNRISRRLYGSHNVF